MKQALNSGYPSKEGLTVEFKSSFNTTVIEALVAFANSKGGSVYVGISDAAEIKGISMSRETLARIINEIKGKTQPSLIPNAEVLDMEGKTVLLLSVPEYPIKPVSTQGRYYKRVGNSNHLLTTSEVVDMHLQTLNSSWDAYPDTHHTLDDISLEKVQRAIGRMQSYGKNIVEDPLTFLQKYNLIREGRPTHAAYLLFKQNDCFLSTIELGHFQTDTIIKDSDRSKADLLTQVEEVMDFVRKHITKEIIITGQAQNTERWQYPLEAIREIVMNMIIHRDYRSSSDSIVKVYNDKIEFFNPGSLPDSITIKDLLSNNYQSRPRNKLIADFCKDLGLIEKYGSGIRRVLELFRTSGLPVPEMRNLSGGFQVTVFAGVEKIADVTESVEKSKEKTSESKEKSVEKMVDVTESVEKSKEKTSRSKEKTSRSKEKSVEKIMAIIRANPKVTQRELIQLTGLTRSGVEKNIRNLREKGLLRRVGSDKRGYWEIIES